MLVILTGRSVAIAAIMAVVAMFASVAAYWLAKGTLRESRAKTYQALLLARAERVDQWLEERLADARYVAADNDVLQLIERTGITPERACADAGANNQVLSGLLDRHFREDAPRAAHIATTDGRILVSLSGNCGRRLSSLVRNQLPDVKQQKPSTINPLAESERLEGIVAEKMNRNIWFEAPILNSGGKRIGYIGYGFDAELHFDKVLKNTSAGFRSELIAFDRRGIILNRGKNPADTPLVEEALTAASSGEPQTEGALMEPFAGRMEHSAVGVWRWLEAGNIGLGLEVAASDTYQPVAILHRLASLFGGLGAVLGILAIWLRRSETGPGGGPRRIGPYRILSQLGEGAVSDVYLAEHILMRRQVALKLLKPQFTTDEWIERFKREVRLAGQLQHPNFVRIFDFGLVSGGHFYYAMELIDGVNLAELVEREGPQQPTLVVQLLKKVCEALEEAHGMGILHRDIKPQNLMIRSIPGEDVQIKVLDFGLVKAVDSEHSRDLTVGLTILGTPAYLSPERILFPAGADPRSDLYSVGAVGFYLLTGRKVFESESDLQLTHRILYEPAPQVSDSSSQKITSELDDLIRRCLAKDPSQRPVSARALADELAVMRAEV